MAEVVGHRFHGMKAELEGGLEQAIKEYGLKHGLTLDVDALKRQGGCSIADLAEQALMHGLDVWTDESEENAERQAGENVVAFPSPTARRQRFRPATAFKVTLSAAGAIAASTLFAAALTDDIDFPGLRTVAHHVYLNNAPAEAIRYVEMGGRFLRVKVERRRGEPGDVMHFVDMRPTSGEIAMGGSRDEQPSATLADGPVLQDSGNRITPEVEDASRG